MQGFVSKITKKNILEESSFPIFSLDDLVNIEIQNAIESTRTNIDNELKEGK